MKVAVVTEPTAQTGETTAAHYGRQLAAALSKQGDDVTLYTRRNTRAARPIVGGDARSEVVSAGPATELAPCEILGCMGEYAQRLKDAWSVDRPDIVHAHSWLPGLGAQLAAGHLGIPTVQSFHGLTAGSTSAAPPSHPNRPGLEVLLAKTASWVIAGSTDEMTTLAGIRRLRARMTMVGTAVDLTEFGAPIRTGEGRRVHIVGLAADLGPGCGLELVIRALPKFPDVELIGAVVGTRGDGSGRLMELAAEAGVGDRVKLLEAWAPSVLMPALRSADLVTCTPWWVPDALPVLRAMACRLPVIATSVGALADTVVDQVTGMLVAPGNTAETIAAMKLLLAQSFLRQSMGSAGRDRVCARYTWERVAAESHAVYENAQYTAVTRPVAGAGSRG